MKREREKEKSGGKVLQEKVISSIKASGLQVKVGKDHCVTS